MDYLLEVQIHPDEELYHRIFAELFLYIRQYRPNQPWRVVVIYTSRSVERLDSVQFPEMIALERVQRFYLDELKPETVSLGVIKLIIEPEEQAVEVARGLLTQVEQEMEASSQNAFIELIETIIIYKFPQKTRGEIATMLGLGDLTQTRFYQEAFGEGRQEGSYLAKLTTIRHLAELNLTVAVIAQVVEMSVTEVQKILDQLEQRDNTSED